MGFKDAGKPHYLGHRERLRRRFREAGPDALPDYELLELILFRAAPRRDTKPLAKALIARFGTFAEVVNAPEELLREVPGIGEAAITELKLVRAAALRLMRGEVLERPVLSSWSQVLDYCRASMGFESKEQSAYCSSCSLSPSGSNFYALRPSYVPYTSFTLCSRPPGVPSASNPARFLKRSPSIFPVSFGAHVTRVLHAVCFIGSCILALRYAAGARVHIPYVSRYSCNVGDLAPRLGEGAVFVRLSGAL